MEYTPISPFMRPISHAHLRVVERPEASVPGKPVNKWVLLRELSKATGKSIAELSPGTIRPPVKPIKIGLLAEDADDGE